MIPGQQDTALAKFEDELFLELCRQHDRVDLFVSSKANELSRRLRMSIDVPYQRNRLANKLHRTFIQPDPTTPVTMCEISKPVVPEKAAAVPEIRAGPGKMR